MKKGFGLILSGGGAKGSYEIGVMKAIEELGRCLECSLIHN